MCSNFEAIKRDRAFLLNLPEPDQLEFPAEVFPTYNAPLVFSNNGNIEWRSAKFGIAREDGMPFTVAVIYESAVIEGEQIRSMSMLTINADKHPFMKQFHAPADEKRSIIVIPEQYRRDWLNADHEHAHEYFFEMSDEYVTFPRENPAPQGSLLQL